MFHITTYIKNKIKRILKNSPQPTSEPRSNEDPVEEAIQAGDILKARVTNGAQTKRFIAASIELQLELVCKALNLTTLALLKVTDDFIYLQAVNSTAEILPGPFPKGAGITAALLKDQEEVSVAAVSKNFAGPVYYPSQATTGSIMAVKLPKEYLGQDSDSSTYILCADRKEATPWHENERQLLRITARKLAMEIVTNHQLNVLDLERDVIQKICSGFRALNRGLGLQSVFKATVNAVSAFVTADFMAISLCGNKTHYTAFINSKIHNHLLGMEYDVNEGIVGQVLKLNHPLPANARYNGPAPVFSRYHTLSGYQSLFIIPLSPEEGKPLGVLTVAAKAANVFTTEQRDILELIAGQVAIKIDLAKSHEKINKMATTDGLTDLANHRTFQHGFDIMLHRARRRKSPLSLIFSDIDFFKKINDNYGHQFGDQVLKAVSKSLADAVRKEDLAARYGGEEFALILENSTKEGALLMAERIRQDISTLIFNYEGKRVGVKISLGIASFPEDATDKSEIIEKADQALYKAKEQGRDQTILWTPDLENIETEQQD